MYIQLKILDDTLLVFPSNYLGAFYSCSVRPTSPFCTGAPELAHGLWLRDPPPLPQGPAAPGAGVPLRSDSHGSLL